MTPRGLVAMAAVLAIGLAAAPAWAVATEAQGALKLSCENGALNLDARDALAPDVFRALEKECGLLLGGSENIPAQPLTVDYEKASLEEEIESLVQLTGLPSTLLATVSSGAFKLSVLATGTPITEPIGGAEPTALNTFGLDGDEAEGAAIDEARRRFLVAQSEEEKQKALEDAKKIYPDAADELGDLDNEERKEAALDDLLMQYYLSRTDEDRKRAYEAVKKLDPEEAKHLLLED